MFRMQKKKKKKFKMSQRSESKCRPYPNTEPHGNDFAAIGAITFMAIRKQLVFLFQIFFFGRTIAIWGKTKRNVYRS